MENSAGLNSKESKQNDRSPDALKQAIARRARELYQMRGCEEGHALEDWLRAEAEVTGKWDTQGKHSAESSSEGEKPRSPASGGAVGSKSAFFNVKVDGVLYTVEYDPSRCDSYRPGMLRKGQPVELRFEQDKVYLKLPNCKELEAKVVRKGQA